MKSVVFPIGTRKPVNGLIRMQPVSPSPLTLKSYPPCKEKKGLILLPGRKQISKRVKAGMEIDLNLSSVTIPVPNPRKKLSVMCHPYSGWNVNAPLPPLSREMS